MPKEYLVSPDSKDPPQIRAWRKPLMAPFVLSALALLTGVAQADTYSYQGAFSKDDDVAVFALTLEAPTTLTIRSFSWGAGTNAAGQLVPGGGFAPVASLFDSSGVLLQLEAGSSTICGPGSGAVDPATNACWDVVLAASLAAGTYRLAFTQDVNTPVGPTWLDGFTHTGQSTYTGLSYLGDASAHFINVDGSQRGSGLAFDLSGTGITVSQIPEPATYALWITAACFGLIFRRKDQT